MRLLASIFTLVLIAASARAQDSQLGHLKDMRDNAVHCLRVALRDARGNHQSQKRLVAECLALVVLYSVLGLLNVMTNYLTISIGQRMVNELRARMFEHLQRLSLSFHRRREIGDLMAFLASDRSAYTTGVIVTIDGGICARPGA